MYHILYVDDEPGLLEIGKIFLEQDKEIVVDTRTSAIPALSLMDSRMYDAVISDYQMPGMDGIAFLKKVRASGNHIPFILFTGKGREEVVIQALNEGADFYLQKGGDPVSQFAELANKIRYAINSKRAEAALHESEERLRLFIRQAPVALAMFDTSMHYLAASRRWMADYHLGDQDLVGHSHYTIFPELTEEIKGVIRRALAGEVSSANEDKFERLDGSVQWLFWEVRPWYTTGNNIGGIIIYSEDITQRKKAELALRESEEKYRQIVETAIEGIWSMDSRFITVFVNRKMTDLLGYTDEEMIGKPIMEFMDPKDLADNAKKLANRQDGINEFYERKFRRKDGTLRWFAVSVTAVKDPDGNFAGSFAMLTDITDRKQAEDILRQKNDELGAAYEQIAATEEELRENLDELAASQLELTASERKYRDLFDNAILGIFRSTPDGQYLDMNPAFATIAGFASPQEMMEAVRDIRQLYTRPEDRMRLNEMLAATGEIHNFETGIRRKDGTTIWISINAKTARDSSGNILWYEGTIEDITTRRKAEQELARKNEELQASHEQITATEKELRQTLGELTLREKNLQEKSEELENRNQIISTILDTTPIAIFMVEAPSGKPILANREAGRLLGRGILPDATVKNLSEVYEAYRYGTGERYPPEEMPIVRGMRGETSHIDDMEVVRPDGTRVRLEIFGNPVRNIRGKIIASLVSFIDITKR